MAEVQRMANGEWRMGKPALVYSIDIAGVAPRTNLPSTALLFAIRHLPFAE
jgi:hypothetical protein